MSTCGLLVPWRAPACCSYGNSYTRLFLQWCTIPFTLATAVERLKVAGSSWETQPDKHTLLHAIGAASRPIDYVA